VYSHLTLSRSSSTVIRWESATLTRSVTYGWSSVMGVTESKAAGAVGATVSVETGCCCATQRARCQARELMLLLININCCAMQAYLLSLVVQPVVGIRRVCTRGGEAHRPLCHERLQCGDERDWLRLRQHDASPHDPQKLLGQNARRRDHPGICDGGAIRQTFPQCVGRGAGGHGCPAYHSARRRCLRGAVR
jgi:hypothetical protein